MSHFYLKFFELVGFLWLTTAYECIHLTCSAYALLLFIQLQQQNSLNQIRCFNAASGFNCKICVKYQMIAWTVHTDLLTDTKYYGRLYSYWLRWIGWYSRNPELHYCVMCDIQIFPSILLFLVTAFTSFSSLFFPFYYVYCTFISAINFSLEWKNKSTTYLIFYCFLYTIKIFNSKK